MKIGLVDGNSTFLLKKLIKLHPRYSIMVNVSLPIKCTS